jgi:hypothetical protein
MKLRVAFDLDETLGVPLIEGSEMVGFKIRADFLIDDSPHHLEHAREHNMEQGYILIPVYGTREDLTDPLLWARQIQNGLESNR